MSWGNTILTHLKIHNRLILNYAREEVSRKSLSELTSIRDRAYCFGRRNSLVYYSDYFSFLYHSVKNFINGFKRFVTLPAMDSLSRNGDEKVS